MMTVQKKEAREGLENASIVIDVLQKIYQMVPPRARPARSTTGGLITSDLIGPQHGENCRERQVAQGQARRACTQLRIIQSKIMFEIARNVLASPSTITARPRRRGDRVKATRRLGMNRNMEASWCFSSLGDANRCCPYA